MQLTPVKEITQESSFADTLLKLIPGEVVGAYIAIDGIIATLTSDGLAKWVSLVVAVVLLALIPLYLTGTYSVKSRTQIVLTMASFIVWLYSLGGPFKLWTIPSGASLYVPGIGTIALILWTVIIPPALMRFGKATLASSSNTVQPTPTPNMNTAQPVPSSAS